VCGFCLVAIGFFIVWHIPFCDGSGDSVSCSDISIIIPAYNEERALPPLLRSLTGQSCSPAEIIVVDDRSTDKTVEAAAQFDVKIVQTPPRPEGWNGKTWACWSGAQAATGDRFLFVDADTRFEHDGLARLSAQHRRMNGMVSIEPYHTVYSSYEQLSALFNAVTYAGINAFTPLGRRLAPSGGFGPCIICTKDDYFALDGHRRVKHSVLENMALGNAFQQRGIALSCYGGRGTLSFRMYPDGFMSMSAGWAKSFAVGAGYTRRWMTLLILLWISGLFTAASAPLHCLLYTTASVTLFHWGLYITAAIQLYWIFSRIGNFSPAAALLFPLDLLFFTVVFARSGIDTWIRKKTSWKGKNVSFK
jgi:4,4'-diaponeurosporenoate glycosyltransferase